MIKNKTIPVKSMITAALFAAIITALSQISFPLPSGVPITLQTFAIALCGYYTGARNGFFSVTAYILLGAAGLPVFSLFTGGIGKLIGLTGGFIFGFIPLVLLCGFGAKTKNIMTGSLFGITGLFFCHLLGAAQYSFLSGMNLLKAAAVVSLPYLIKDILSVIAAFLIVDIINKKYKRQ